MKGETIPDSQSQIKAIFQMDCFKSKYRFEPFQHEEKLQQTLKHQINALNHKIPSQKHLHENILLEEILNLQGELQNQNSILHSKGFIDNDRFPSSARNLDANSAKFFEDLRTQKSHRNGSKRSKNFDQFNDQNRNADKRKNCKVFPQKVALSKIHKAQTIPEEECEDSSIQSNQRINFASSCNIIKKALPKKLKHEAQNNPNFFFKKSGDKKNLKRFSSSIKQSLCHSNTLDETSIHNSFNKSTNLEKNAVFLNQSNVSLKTLQTQEFLSFYQFCMLMFPETAKQIPCSVFIIDTLFYVNGAENKDIFYVYKDKRRGALMKMRNKNKSAFELFMKRRQNYEAKKAKEEKLKKAGFYGRTIVAGEQSIENPKLASSNQRNKKFFPSVSELIDENISQHSIAKEKQVSPTVDNLALSRKNWSSNLVQMSSQCLLCLPAKKSELQRSHLEVDETLVAGSEELKKKLELKLSLESLSFNAALPTYFTSPQLKNRLRCIQQNYIEGSVLITPSNSARETVLTLQTNYIALLKYNSNHIIRLKANQFKNIFQNPLYANERFKNINNTQYIQALPVQDEFKDIKVYSIHFHNDFFKNDKLFLYIKNSLYKQNQFIGGCQTEESQSQFAHSSLNNVFEVISQQRKQNLQLKQSLKQQSIEVYLHYQIFQICTYVSMHHNKQILNGIFRFIQYDNDYALFQTQNLHVRSLPKEAEFIKAKIFKPVQMKLNDKSRQQNEQLKQKKSKIKETSNALIISNIQQISSNSFRSVQSPLLKDQVGQAVRSPVKNKKQQLQALQIEASPELSMLQKQINNYFTQQNIKIQQEMTRYLKQKIQKIRNIKDSHLSKNIFQIINPAITSQNNKFKLIPKNYLFTEILSINNQNQPQKNSEKLNHESKDNQDQLDFHKLLNDDNQLKKFLQMKQLNDQYGRRNISNYSVVRWKKDIKKIKERKINCQNQQQLFSFDKSTVISNENKNSTKFSAGKYNCTTSDFNKLSFGKSTQFTNCKTFSNQFASSACQWPKKISRRQSEKENRSIAQNFSEFLQPVMIAERLKSRLQLSKQEKRLEKKLMNEKYSQWNKNKFELNAFKINRFI